MDSNFPELMTVQEVAKVLHISPVTIRRWAEAGNLDAIELPNKKKRKIYRIPRATIERVVQIN